LQKEIAWNEPVIGGKKMREEEKIRFTKGPKIGRNNPCPCGSEKKYKKCCGK